MKTKLRRMGRGFTLLEILIVVGILALLAAFVVPSLMGSQEEARKDLARAAVGRNGEIAQALNKFKLYAARFPESDEGLEALFKRPSSIEDDSQKWRGPYLEGSPEDLKDPWDNEYVFDSPGKFNEDGYDLYSKGPDGEEGTDDDIKNWSED